MRMTVQGSARTLMTDQDAQQYLYGLPQGQSREDGINTPFLSMKGKYDFVPFWKKKLTFICVHKC